MIESKSLSQQKVCAKLLVIFFTSGSISLSNILFCQTNERAHQIRFKTQTEKRISNNKNTSSIDLTTTPQGGSINSSSSPVDTLIQEVIDAKNVLMMLGYARSLTGEKAVMINGKLDTIKTRAEYPLGNDKAALFIKQTLQKYGLTTYEQQYSTNGKNIYAVQTGIKYPNKKYILCAHYDAVSISCPGADDNASGTAAVLEAARILSDYATSYTIVYALWDQEELGLRGSSYYAQQASAAGDSIVGVINLDMIAWDSNKDNIANIFSDSTSGSLQVVKIMTETNSTYDIGLSLVWKKGSGRSDESSFYRNGYSGLLLIEDNLDFNWFYHREGDVVKQFNYSFYDKCFTLALATVARIAEIAPFQQRPLLSSPVDESKGIATNPILKWNDARGATVYQLQISDSINFNRILFDFDQMNSTSIKISGLKNNTKYYWRVRAIGSFGASNWSEIWMFKTTVPAPILTSPPDGSVISLTNPILKWNPAEEATMYSVQVSEISTFKFFDVNAGGLIHTSLQVNGLSDNTMYYWRVKSSNAEGVSPWSEPWTFTTQASTNINQDKNIALHIFLNQNYPNPISISDNGNALTTISFYIPSEQHVTLKVYDQLGREVATLVNEYKQAGNYETKFDALNVSNGIYLYKLIAGNNIRVKRMIVQK